jgi:hypothetical protein
MAAYIRRVGAGSALLVSVWALAFAGAGRAQDEPAAPAGAASSPVSPASDSGEDDKQDVTKLAEKLQNPIGDLISFPFQSNTNFSYGPNHGTQELLNIQPVIPFHIGDKWNIITRTILPLIWQPSLQPAADTVPFGTGPITLSAFLSPAVPSHGWLWGLGPVTQIPAATSVTLGSNVWGLGPTGVLVYMHGPWVTGVLVNNVWSLGGQPLKGTKYNNFLAQPFVNFNMKGGWYVGSSPLLTANWLATGDQAWIVPIGGNIGRVMRFSKKLPPINLSMGAYANVIHPTFGPTWQLRTQITAIF